MFRTYARGVALILCLFGALGAVRCHNATAIFVDVYSEVACAASPAAVLTVGREGELKDRAPAAVSTRCEPVPDTATTTNRGSVRLVPSGSDNAEVAFEVAIRPDGGDASSCNRSDYADCIVARRILRYLPGEELHVRVDLRFDCLNIPCDQESTCVRSQCVDAHVEPENCRGGAGCGDEALGDVVPMPDAGTVTTEPPPPSPDASQSMDAGGPRDSGGMDAQSAPDAARDASSDARVLPPNCASVSDCVNCLYPRAPTTPDDCHCLTCPDYPMSVTECGRNTAAYVDLDCRTVVGMCPEPICLEAPPPGCSAQNRCVADTCRGNEDCTACELPRPPRDAGDCFCPEEAVYPMSTERCDELWAAWEAAGCTSLECSAPMTGQQEPVICELGVCRSGR